MKARSPSAVDQDELREKIIGLGEHSFRKSYYPELQRRLADLERFKTLLDQSNDIIFLLDSSGKFTYINRSLCRYLGFCGADNLLGKPVHAIMPSIDRELLAPLFSGAQDSIVFKTVFSGKNGELKPFEVNMRSVALENTRNIVTVARDIAERLRSEEVLRTSAQKYRRLYDSLMDAYGFTGLDGRFVEFNASFLKLTGYSAEELRRLSVTDITPAKWHEMESDIIERQVLTRGYSDIYEKEYRRRDGTVVPVELRTFMVRDDQGNPAGMWAITRDITARKRDRENLKQSYDKAQKLLFSVVSAISKLVELRDPYTAGHQRHVAKLAHAIACELGFPDSQAEWIRVAGLVHDIGKIEVPAEILSRPGKLNALEKQIINVHPTAGYEILRVIDFPWPVADVVYQHHERIDGSGYPRGLKDDQICQGARIVSVADTVEAMSFHRPYRTVVGVDKALEEIQRGRGFLYYAPAVDACIKLFREKHFDFDAPAAAARELTLA